ncbi:MAG: hypothetical protein ABH821_00355 [archaeon]
MNWLNKLKHLVKNEFNFNAPIFDNRKIIILNDSFNTKSKIFPNKEDKETYLNIASLNERQKKAFKQILQEYLEEGNKLLQSDTANLLESLYKHSKEKNDQQILKFFKEVIPDKDLETLEAALYLRTIFKQGKNVTKLKRDIRDIFGNRGNNITNLCSAGYFENFLIPLYNATKDEGKKFKELYELIVDKAIIAVFVYKDMNQEEIPQQIKEKIQLSKKYGIGFIHIHGIGASNVAKIKECLEIKKKTFFDFFEKKVFEKENIIIIELILE